jgi:hypothetical protein
MVGYDREDLASGRLRWTDLTPPEWLERDERQWVPELKMTGVLTPFREGVFLQGCVLAMLYGRHHLFLAAP